MIRTTLHYPDIKEHPLLCQGNEVWLIYAVTTEGIIKDLDLSKKYMPSNSMVVWIGKFD